jgi:anthranilate synthase/aminodeoxychorismate synthase-like glutamine amidotransferase
MVIVIDNYDSFVFNLSRYVEELGYQTEVYRNDKISVENLIVLQPSHIILSPGPCTPNEAGICLELIQQLEGRLPILGVCLGHQAIAQAYGARVIRAAKPMHGQSDLITHDGKGLFRGLPDVIQVARYHSLSVDPSSLPPALKCTAWTKNNEIMALAHQTHPVVGVQFHPESILTQKGHQLLHNFLCCR